MGNYLGNAPNGKTVEFIYAKRVWADLNIGNLSGRNVDQGGLHLIDLCMAVWKGNSKV